MIYALLLTACLGMADGDWLQWGGPQQNFQVKSTIEPWSKEGPKELWRKPLGDGYAGILHRDDVLYTQYREGDDQYIVALNAADGEILWRTKHGGPVYPGMERSFGDGPNATPLIVDDRLVVIDIAGRIQCVSLSDGKPLWNLDMTETYGRIQRRQEFGYSSSPALYDGAIIVLAGGTKGGVVALNPKDGSEVWRSKPSGASYASPVVTRLLGRDQILYYTSEEVVGLDAKNGTRLWGHPVKNRYLNNCTDPIVLGEDTVWASTQLDGGTRLIRLSDDGGKIKTEEVWSNLKIKVFHWNSIVEGDFIYSSIGTSTTTLAGVNWRTGKIEWQKRGYQKVMALNVDGRMLSLDENGYLRLTDVTPKGAKKLAETKVSSKFSWTVPTLIGDQLFIRDRKEIMAFEL